jgi:hypothetical protein
VNFTAKDDTPCFCVVTYCREFGNEFFYDALKYYYSSTMNDILLGRYETRLGPRGDELLYHDLLHAVRYLFRYVSGAQFRL